MPISRRWSKQALSRESLPASKARIPPPRIRYPVPSIFVISLSWCLTTGLKGPKEIAFSEGEEGVEEFYGAWETANLLRNLRECLISKLGKVDVDEVVPSYMVESVEDAARHTVNDAAIESAYTQTIPEDTMMPMTPEEIKAAEAALNARKAAMDIREAGFSERETVSAELEAREAAIDAKEASVSGKPASPPLNRPRPSMPLLPTIAEGKVLLAEKGKLVNFMASIDAEHVFEFREGEETHSESARDHLLDLLTSRSKRVDINEHAKAGWEITITRPRQTSWPAKRSKPTCVAIP